MMMKYVVIGGAGNLGGEIIKMILHKQDVQPHQVVSLDLVTQGGIAGIENHKFDLADPESGKKLERLLTEFSDTHQHVIVFHTAAIIDIRPVPSALMREVNVEGTRRVVEACQAIACSKAKNAAERPFVTLVYSSSIECANGYLENGQPQRLEGLNEDAPYPARYLFPYAQTKAEAEQLVLAANNPSGNLITVSLRPGYIVGPRNIGMKLEVLRAFRRSKRYPVYVTAKVPCNISCVHVTNCAIAHLLAAAKAPQVAGEKFFITDFDASTVVDCGIYCVADSPVRLFLVPVWLAITAVWLMDRLERFLHWFYKKFLGRTRVTSIDVVDVEAMKMCWHDVCVSNERAVERLGYGKDNNYPPLFDRKETLKQTREWTHSFIQTCLEEAEQERAQCRKNANLEVIAKKLGQLFAYGSTNILVILFAVMMSSFAATALKHQ